MTSKTSKQDHAGDRDLIDAARKSVDQIWQAGLGAFARAQQEGGELFSKLVHEGMAIQKRTQNMAEEQLAGMTSTISKMADNLGKQASGSLGKIETAIEDRLAQSLEKIGVPTREDIEHLGKQITDLQHAVNALLTKKPATKATQKTAQKAATAAPKKRAAAKSTKTAKASTARATSRTSGRGNGKRASAGASARA